jgi:uncharacterized membrane protein YgcG
MQRGQPQHAWRAWRDTIIVVVAIIAIGSLASANPSLRAPRGPHESILVVPTGATGASGPAGLSAPTGTTTPEIEPAQKGEPPSDGVDFTACEGLTGLDNAICRHEALLVVHPDNQGLQNSLTHLLERRAEHDAKAGEEDGGNVPPGNGSSSSSSHGQGHGQSGGSHGNAGGNGKGNSGGSGH